MQSVFLNIAKFADFQRKNIDPRRTQGLYHVIHIIFGFSWGKLKLCQVSLLPDMWDRF